MLRVDDKRIDVDWAGKILEKAGGKAVTANAANDGVTGRVTPEIIKLRKDALKSDSFATSTSLQQHENLITSQIYLGKKPLGRVINHCVSAEEIDALRYAWEHLDKLHNPRLSPLGEGKDISLEKVRKNLENKKKRGVEEYIEYEFEFAGKSWMIKTERHRNGFEQFYHIRKK